ncbi:MAG: hypothetical protein WCF79_24490 [Rhodomicrobium sp.]
MAIAVIGPIPWHALHADGRLAPCRLAAQSLSDFDDLPTEKLDCSR